MTVNAELDKLMDTIQRGINLTEKITRNTTERIKDARQLQAQAIINGCELCQDHIKHLHITERKERK
jgi:hypothetical protein